MATLRKRCCKSTQGELRGTWGEIQESFQPGGVKDKIHCSSPRKAGATKDRESWDTGHSPTSAASVFLVIPIARVGFCNPHVHVRTQI